MQNLGQLFLIILEVLLNVLPRREGLCFLSFLLFHKVLPDILKVLRLHDPQLAAGCPHVFQGRLHFWLFPHEEPPDHDCQTQVLVLLQGLSYPVGAGHAGAGGDVPGDVVAGAGLALGQDGVEKGHFCVGGCVLVFQVTPRSHRLSALGLDNVAQEGFVPARAVFHVPELEFEKYGWEALPVERGEERSISEADHRGYGIGLVTSHCVSLH